jgi:hypothetical protein
MQHASALISQLLVCGLAAILSFSDSLALAQQTHCDLPTAKALRSEKASTAPECASICNADALCQSYVHISGWGRCFLKKDTPKRQTKLIMHAGARDDAAASIDSDHTAKDLRRISGIKSAPACQAECRGEPQCTAFAYLDGYGDCWLKKGSGRIISKIFSCGFRSRKV